MCSCSFPWWTLVSGSMTVFCRTECLTSMLLTTKCTVTKRGLLWTPFFSQLSFSSASIVQWCCMNFVILSVLQIKENLMERNILIEKWMFNLYGVLFIISRWERWPCLMVENFIMYAMYHNAIPAAFAQLIWVSPHIVKVECSNTDCQARHRSSNMMFYVGGTNNNTLDSLLKTKFIPSLAMMASPYWELLR